LPAQAMLNATAIYPQSTGLTAKAPETSKSGQGSHAGSAKADRAMRRRLNSRQRASDRRGPVMRPHGRRGLDATRARSAETEKEGRPRLPPEPPERRSPEGGRADPLRLRPLIGDAADVNRHACLPQSLCQVRLDAGAFAHDCFDRAQLDHVLVAEERSAVAVASVSCFRRVASWRWLRSVG